MGEGGWLVVHRAGWQTTVQDLGRWGRQAQGIPVAGPMDPYAARAANAVVGNPREMAVLETTLVGPEIAVEDDRLVAVTGAAALVTVEGREVSVGRPIALAAGQRLRVGNRTNGARNYVAVAGGIATPLVMGSRATDLASGIGGVDGRALVAGDRLPLGPRPVDRAVEASVLNRGLTLQDRPTDASGANAIRIVPGPHLDWFEPEALDLLLSGPYRIAPESNRMGYRLEGPAFHRRRSSHFPSDATPLGSIQVAAPGQLVLLMADHQTTGGYPKIATVITADIGVAGQLAPGDAIRFVRCDLREADDALRLLEHRLAEIEVRFAR